MAEKRTRSYHPHSDDIDSEKDEIKLKPLVRQGDNIKGDLNAEE